MARRLSASSFARTLKDGIGHTPLVDASFRRGVLVIPAQKVTLSYPLIWADIFGAAEYKSLMSLTISFFALRGSLRSDSAGVAMARWD